MAELRDPRVAATDPTSCGVSPNAVLDSPSTALLSVILVGQRSLAAQRRGRYVAGSGAHPARMAPDLATALINDYTRPGDLVFDPLAGIGTSLVEAVHAGRNGFGIEYEPGWVALARANIALARTQGGQGHARIVRGDATRLPRRVPAELRGQISLVLTSPPYGRTMHGRVDHRHGPLSRFHNTYNGQRRAGRDDAGNLGHRPRAGLIDGVTAVLTGCLPLLKPGGVIAVVARPWRRDQHLVDLPGQIIGAASAAGLDLVARRVALHAAVRDGRLVARHSFFQLHVARESRAKGRPVSLIQHDNVNIYRPAAASAQDHPYPGPPLRRGPHTPVTAASTGPEKTAQPAISHCDGESRYRPAAPDPQGLSPVTVHQCPTDSEHESGNDDRTRRPRRQAVPR
jgi:modification methylase